MVNILNPGDLPSIDLSNIKGVLIDIDDTLYSYKTSHKLAIEACFKEFNSLFPNLFIFDEFNNLYRKARNEVTSRLQNTGSCRSRLLAFQMIFEEIEQPSLIDGYNNALQFEKLYWFELINSIKRNEHVFQFINQCIASSIKVCAVSDMQTLYQIKKLNKLGYKDIFLVTSEEVGYEKPHPAIFHQALQKVNCAAEHVIMIGDNYEKDIKGAQKVGIPAFQIELND